jgi:hypothetical protein
VRDALIFRTLKPLSQAAPAPAREGIFLVAL